MNKKKRKTKKRKLRKTKNKKLTTNHFLLSIKQAKTILILVYVFGIIFPIYHVLWHSVTRGWDNPLFLGNVRNTLFFGSIFFALVLNTFLWWLTQHTQQHLKITCNQLAKNTEQYFEIEEQIKTWKTLQISSLVYFLINIFFWPASILFAKIVIDIIKPLF